MKHPMPTAPKTKALLLWLSKGHPVTIWNAMAQLHVGALSQRIGDLRRLGWPIRDQWRKNGTARFKEYRL